MTSRAGAQNVVADVLPVLGAIAQRVDAPAQGVFHTQADGAQHGAYLGFQGFGFLLQAGFKGADALLQLVDVGLQTGSVFVFVVGQQAQVLHGLLQMLAVGAHDAGVKNGAGLGLQAVQGCSQAIEVFLAGRRGDHGQRYAAHQRGDVGAQALHNGLHIFGCALVGLGDDEHDGHLGNGQFEQGAAQAVAQGALFAADHHAIGQAAAHVTVNHALIRCHARIPAGQVHQHQLGPRCQRRAGQLRLYPAAVLQRGQAAFAQIGFGQGQALAIGQAAGKTAFGAKTQLGGDGGGQQVLAQQRIEQAGFAAAEGAYQGMRISKLSISGARASMPLWFRPWRA